MDANVKKYLFDPVMDMNMWMLENPDQFIAGGGALAAAGMDTALGNKPSKWAARALFSPNHFWSGKELPDYKIPAPSPINKMGAYLKALGVLSYPTAAMGEMPGFNFMMGDGTVPEGHWEKYANELGDMVFTSNEDAPKTKTIAGQQHELAYITPEEAELLKMHGGAGIDSDDDGIKEYWDIFGSDNPANQDEASNHGNWIGAKEWTYGANEDGSGGITLTAPDTSNLNSEDSKWSGGKEGVGHYHESGWRPDGTPGDSNDDINRNNAVVNANNVSVENQEEVTENPFDISLYEGVYNQQSGNILDADIYDIYGKSYDGIPIVISKLTEAIDSGDYTNTEEMENLLAKYQGLDDTLTGLQTNLDTAIKTNVDNLSAYEKANALSAIDIANMGDMDIESAKKLKTELEKGNVDYQYDPNLDFELFNLTGNDASYDTGYDANIAALNNIISNYNTAATGLTSAWDNIDTDTLNTTISNLDLNDPATAKTQLDTLIKEVEAAGNASGLSPQQIQTLFEESGISSALEQATTGINTVNNARAAEAARIQAAVNQELADAQGISGQVLGANPYSKAALDALQGQITSGLGDISGFESTLPFDFSRATSEYTNAQNYLNELIAERDRNLKNIRSDLTNAYSGFDSINLWEEDAYNKLARQLGFVGDDLGMYSGGIVGDIYSDLDTYRKNVSDKLFELGQYRGRLEDDAIDFLSRLEGANTNRELYDQYSGEWSPIADEISKYRASQAYDERSDIVAELAKRLKTIEQDEQNVADRMARASSDLNDYQFADYRLVDPLSTVNTGYGLYNEDEDELMLGNNIGSAFSQNVLRF